MIAAAHPRTHSYTLRIETLLEIPVADRDQIISRVYAYLTEMIEAKPTLVIFDNLDTQG